ncbi:tetratricopeptide repeat-containing sensor histidine kinase [Taibaiella lutea]|uniref:tetratricopeptide repeat-containing sensor histidine kinase n=1 Tax=Taibaiella lutea TaxID=2608001 RepID=UPI00167FE1D8|nr:sensor histidine kinase [Taibaiella lutea]
MQVLLCFLFSTTKIAAQERTYIEHAVASEAQMNRIDDENDKVYEWSFTHPDSALRVFKRIFNESQQLDYAFGMANAMILSANVYINVKREEPVDPAIPCLRIAEKYLERARKRNKSVVETWYNNMGAVYLKKNQTDSAMICLSKSLDLYLQSGHKKDGVLVMKYLNLETVFYVLQQFDKVIAYAKTAEKIALEHNLKGELYKTYTMLASVYTEINKPDSSLYYLALMDKIPYKPDESFSKLTLEIKGTAYLKKNMPEKAIPYFLQSIAINNYPAPNSWQGLGNAYKRLKKYKLSESYLLQAENYETNASQRSDYSVSVYNDLADLYDSTYQYKNAYKYRSKAALLQKELDDNSNVQTINALEARYRNAQKDKQLTDERLAFLSIQNKLKNRNLWIAVIIGCIVISVMIILVLYQKQKLWKQKSETLEQQQEIENLKTSILTEENERSRIGRQLHDDIMVQLALVKMNLEALPSQLPEIEEMEDFIAVKEMMDNAGRDLRLTAHNLAPDTLLADGLTQALLYFCKNIQYRTRLNVTFQHYGEAPALNQELSINIYRITQELIQNIIKHAAASNVLIQLNYRPDILTLTVEDDGKGFKTNDIANEGIGLKSIKSRLKVMKGEMEIHERHPKGTSVTIQVNL